MSVSAEGRVLLSTHDLERAGAFRAIFRDLGYGVELVTPEEELSGEPQIQLLLITAEAGSRSAGDLCRQARTLSQAPTFAIVDNPDEMLRLSRSYSEVFGPQTDPADVATVARALIERRRLQAMLGIVGETDAMREALERVVQFAPVTSTVLVTGESGTGKELIARGIHHLSPRRHRPFIAVNVAALSGTLLESELFGHEKGAFTGAIDSRKGFFELAHGGTIFLDEIGEMPLATQTKLLRVLEQQEFHRVGGQEAIRVDVRIVAATNQELKKLVAVGQFRKDLYYRLNVLHIELPPLTRRREDIPLLVDAFIQSASARHDRTFEGISAEAMQILQDYHWPGNVRELQNLIESMVVLAPGREVLPEDIPREVRGLESGVGALVRVGADGGRTDEVATGPDLRPQLEFIFRALVDLRMDVDDLKQEFEAYRHRSAEATSTIEAYALDRRGRDRSAAARSRGGGVVVGQRRGGGGRGALGRRAGAGYGGLPVGNDDGGPGTRGNCAALGEVRGNRRRAARLLAIGERTLYRKIRRFGLGDH